MTPTELSSEQRGFHRDRLRDARAKAAEDAEGFLQICQALEHLGQQMQARIGNGLASYTTTLQELAQSSAFAFAIPQCLPRYHTSFQQLFEELCHARNDAVHEGSRARYVTEHAVELALITEDALMATEKSVGQFMVRHVAVAHMWHSISFIRQEMLKHAYTSLPFRASGMWHFVSEHNVARFLRIPNPKDRKARLVCQLERALEAGLGYTDAEIVGCGEDVMEAAKKLSSMPLLIVDEKHPERLLGILTAADLM